MSAPRPVPGPPAPVPSGASVPAVVWVVAGPPGAGKSTAARALARLLSPPGAVLDKDTLFSGLVAEVIDAHGRGQGEREGSWYDEHAKRHEYAGLTAAAAEIRRAGCPPVLVAPFTQEIRDPDRWAAWVGRLGGDPVRLVWVSCPAAELYQRLLRRGRGRDAGKVAAFEEFAARMRPEEPPPVPHWRIDTSDARPRSSVQLAALLGGGEVSDR
ncbi:MAG: AAA family ATPase [Kineosporiaceae bacterium]